MKRFVPFHLTSAWPAEASTAVGTSILRYGRGRSRSTSAHPGKTSDIETGFEFDLLRRWKRSTNFVAQSGGGSGEAKCAFGLGLSGGGTCEALEKTRNSAFVVKLLKNFDAFAKELAGARVVALIASEIAEVCESAGDAPVVAKFAKQGQGLFVTGLSGGGIAFITGDVALIVDGPGNPSVVADPLTNRE